VSNFFTDIPRGLARCGSCDGLFNAAAGHYCPGIKTTGTSAEMELDFYTKEALMALDSADLVLEDLQARELDRKVSLRLVALDALISQAEDCLEDLRAKAGLDPIG
jgi:hypothetical protein